MMIFTFAIAISCDRAPTPVASTVPSGRPTVASLSPAATDLIVAMGLADRLVAVSNYEPPRKVTDDLPRVGDYRTADWEKIAAIRPGIIITQYREDKMPDGFADRAASLNIKVFNRKIDSLQDSFETIGELGKLLNAPHAAAEAADRWQNRFNAIKKSVKGKPSRNTLLIVGETGLSGVGPNTFLSDLLKIAGGKNVLTDGGDYPNLDREKLAALNPDVVIQLLPSASPQTMEQAAGFWKTMPNLSAVKRGAIHPMTDADVLLPGFNVTRTAERFAEILHGAAESASATRRSSRQRKRLNAVGGRWRRKEPTCPLPSREAAAESSLGRKPQVDVMSALAPKGRKNDAHRVFDFANDRHTGVNIRRGRVRISFVLSPLRGLWSRDANLGLTPQDTICHRFAAGDADTGISSAAATQSPPRGSR